VHAFWAKISTLFGSLWVPDLPTSGERLAYLQERRKEQHVAFQAIFLQALGRLCYRMGTLANWQVDSQNLAKLEDLNPDTNNYAAKGSNGYNMAWVDAMMKASTDKTGIEQVFVFNNVADSITKTFKILCEKVGIPPVDDGVTPAPAA
jgi:hypothetical protein